MHALGGCRCVLGLSAIYASAALLDMLPGGCKTGCVGAAYCCVSAEFMYYCGHSSSLQRPPNSNETPAYYTKHVKIGKYENSIYESGPYEKQECMPVLFSGFGSQETQPNDSI